MPKKGMASKRAFGAIVTSGPVQTHWLQCAAPEQDLQLESGDHQGEGKMVHGRICGLATPDAETALGPDGDPARAVGDDNSFLPGGLASVHPDGNSAWTCMERERRNVGRFRPEPLRLDSTRLPIGFDGESLVRRPASGEEMFQSGAGA